MNNKIIVGIIAIVLIALGGLIYLVRSSSAPVADDGKLTVLSTFTVIADMVREVGGDKVNAISLTKPGTEIHGYEPTPGDIARATQADVIFDNGLNLELWASKLYASIPNVPHVTLSDGVDVRYIAEGAYKDKPNPHAWMSPKQALVYVENIRASLVELDPQNADTYNANAAAYSDKIRALDAQLRMSLDTIPAERRTLVSCEGAFSYLTEDYGMQELYLWAINDENQGSPQQIAKVVDEVKDRHIPTVFCESTVEPRIQREVVAASGAKLGGLLYVDSLSDDRGPAPTYLDLLAHTVDTITTGLVHPETLQ